MKRARSARGFVVVASTALALVLCVQVALPVLQNGGSTEVELTDLGSNEWEIRNRHYMTLLTTEEEYGGVGLELGGTGGGADASVVMSVDAADIVQTGTSTSLGYSFVSNGTVASEFNMITPGTWSGFQAQSPGTMANLDVDVVFTVTVMPGTTFAQLKTEVEAGNVGTAETNSGGTIIASGFVNPTGTVTQGGGGGGGGGPAMGDPWLAALVGLTIAVGLFALRRGQQRARPVEAR